jgi:starch synthase (maltosyl-transferring)
VYAGYELYEHVAVRPGSEEYLDSEKYQIRVRDWEAADQEGRTLAPYLTRLNGVRRAHPALQRLRNVVIHSSDDENVLVFSKATGAWSRLRSTDGGGSTGGGGSTTGEPDDLVIVVINLDPHAARETMVHLDLPALGLDWHDSLAVHDEITGQDWHWGQHNYVRLDPGVEPAHLLTVRRTA